MLKLLLKNSTFILFSSLLGRGTVFLINLIFIRVLSQDDYGRFAILRSTATTIEGFISGAIGLLTIREISKDTDKPPILNVLLVHIIYLIIVLSLLFLFLDNIQKRINYDQSTFSLLLFLSTLIISTKIYSVIQNIYLGLEKYKAFFICSLISSLLSCIFIYFTLSIYSNYSVSSAVLLIIIFYLIDSVIKYIYLLKIKLGLSKSKNFKIIKFFNHSYIYILSMLVSGFSFWYVRTLIVNSKNGFSELARFDALYQVLTIVAIVTGSVTSLLISKLAKEKSNQNKVILNSLIINLFVVIIMSLSIHYSSNFILISLGEKYNTTSNIDLLNSMIIIAFLITLSSIFNKVLVANEKDHCILINNAVSSSLLLFTTYMENNFSATSLSTAYIAYYAASFLIYLIFYYVYIYKKHNNKTMCSSSD